MSEVLEKTKVPVVCATVCSNCESIVGKETINKFTAEDIDEKVFCLMTKSQNFTVNDIIVHNCRGYRSEWYPDGIDTDTAQYLSSLIPQERGFLWSIHDAVYGNEEKGRAPIAALVNELDKYPGLLEIIESIDGSKKNWPLNTFSINQWG